MFVIDRNTQPFISSQVFKPAFSLSDYNIMSQQGIRFLITP